MLDIKIHESNEMYKKTDWGVEVSSLGIRLTFDKVWFSLPTPDICPFYGAYGFEGLKGWSNYASYIKMFIDQGFISMRTLYHGESSGFSMRVGVFYDLHLPNEIEAQIQAWHYKNTEYKTLRRIEGMEISKQAYKINDENEIHMSGNLHSIYFEGSHVGYMSYDQAGKILLGVDRDDKAAEVKAILAALGGE